MYVFMLGARSVTIRAPLGGALTWGEETGSFTPPPVQNAPSLISLVWFAAGFLLILQTMTRHLGGSPLKVIKTADWQGSGLDPKQKGFSDIADGPMEDTIVPNM